MRLLAKHKCTIEDLGARLDESYGHERDSANDIADLSKALEEEQDRRSALEETFVDLQESYNEEMSKLRKDHDHAQALAKIIKTKK